MAQVVGVQPAVKAVVGKWWIGAGDRDRTGDVQLGKLTFYR